MKSLNFLIRIWVYEAILCFRDIQKYENIKLLYKGDD